MLRIEIMRRLLMVTCLLGMPCVSCAQTKRTSWESLNILRAGQKIEVVETGMKKHAGTFLTVSEEVIQLREDATDQTIKRENVLRVTVLEKSNRLRNILILGAVGAGVGAGVGAAAPSILNHDLSPGQGKGPAAATFAVVGFAAGAAVGAVLPSHETVYRAKPH